LWPHKRSIASAFPNENLPSVILPTLEEAFIGDSSPDGFLRAFEAAEPLDLINGILSSGR
jgi:hypothetical protein